MVSNKKTTTSTKAKSPKGRSQTLKGSKSVGAPKVVMQVLPSMRSGGVERGVVEIHRACHDTESFSSIVVSEGGNMVAQLQKFGGVHEQLPVASKNPWVILKNIHRIEQLIKKYNVNIVHARSRAPAWSAYFAAKRSGCHFVTTFHGVYSIGSFLKKWYNQIMIKGEVVITASNFIKDHVLKQYQPDESKIRSIARGVDLEQFDVGKLSNIRLVHMAEQLKLDHADPIILMPGRLTEWKGQEVLIKALSLMVEQGCDKFVCLLAGDDKHHSKYRQRLEQHIRALGLISKVHLVGHIADMPALYAMSDVVVSASTRPESFGRVAIEAGAMERPVVATNHGGSCETIIDGKTGWLVEPGCPQSLADGIKKAIALSDKNRTALAKRVKKHIKTNYSMQQMVDKTLDVYREVLSS